MADTKLKKWQVIVPSDTSNDRGKINVSAHSIGVRDTGDLIFWKREEDGFLNECYGIAAGYWISFKLVENE